MTRDPREALEPCPFCGGEAKIFSYRTSEDSEGVHVECIKCGVRTDATDDAYADRITAVSMWNTRALTASPGEQEPPPTAGWDDNQLQLIIERALLDDEYFGNRAADEDQLEAQAHGSAALIVEALRRVAPAPDGVSTPPAASESNASVEARLMEALTPSATTKAAYIGEFHFFIDDRDEDGEECALMVTVPWTTTKEIMKAILDRALSAVGDEAKKSGGRTDEAKARADAVASGSASHENHGSQIQTGVGSERSSPSDQPYWREIVARALMEKWPGDYAWGDETREPNELAFETADAILAALDGGAGA